MIDWNKPIETMDGRKARLIESNATEPGIWHIVYVSSIADPYGFGDVFIVNNEGYRCDDRAIYSKRQEPFIRNTRGKREGWVNIYAVYQTKEDAEKACADLRGKCARFVRWEE